MKRKVLSADYHRNGIAGEGFYVVLFEDDDGREILRTRAHRFPCVLYDKGAFQVELDGPPLRVLDLPCGEWHEWRE